MFEEIHFTEMHLQIFHFSRINIHLAINFISNESSIHSQKLSATNSFLETCFLIDQTPLSQTNFQIYKKWPSPVFFFFSKSMVYWGYKINKTKKKFFQIFILWILEVFDVTEVKKDPKTHEN